MAAAQVLNTWFLKEGKGGTVSPFDGTTQNETAVIEFDQVVEDVNAAVIASGFKPGQQIRTGALLFLSDSISAEVHQDDTGKTWIFDLVYNSAAFNPTENDNSGSYRPEIKTGKWSYTIVVDRDKKTGDPIANTVGDPYDPLPIETISAPVLSITIQEYNANMGRLAQLGSINNGAVTIAGLPAPLYCCMFDDYQSTAFWDEEGYLSFKNTFTFKYKWFKNKAGNEIGFKLEAINQGFNEKDATAPNDKVEIKVADPEFPTDRTKDVPVAVPQMLTEAGAKTNTPFYQEWVVHDLLDFTQFGLPTAYPVI